MLPRPPPDRYHVRLPLGHWSLHISTTCHFTLPWEGREERAGRETATTDFDLNAVFNAAPLPSLRLDPPEQTVDLFGGLGGLALRYFRNRANLTAV